MPPVRCRVLQRRASGIVSRRLGSWRGRDTVASGRTSRCRGRTRSSGSRWRGLRAWSICHFPFAFGSRSSIGPGNRRAKAEGAYVEAGPARLVGGSGHSVTRSRFVSCGSVPSCACGQAALDAGRLRLGIAPQSMIKFPLDGTILTSVLRTSIAFIRIRRELQADVARRRPCRADRD